MSGMYYSVGNGDDVPLLPLQNPNTNTNTSTTVRGTTNVDESTGTRHMFPGHRENRDMESNTKLYGIGASLAFKMGYQPGKGLGKNLQGISDPVEATQTRGRTGIGSSQLKTKKIDSLPMDDLRINRSTSKSGEKLMWRKGSEKDKEVKTETVTQPVRIDEVLDAKHRNVYMRPNRPCNLAANTKVIDMTGPETKVLDGLSARFSRNLQVYRSAYMRDCDSEVANLSECSLHDESIKSTFGAPELIYNINQMIGNCEEDITKSSRKTKWALKRETMIKSELERLLKKVQQRNSQIQSTQALINLIQKIVPGIAHGEAIQIFTRIRTEHPGEWRVFQYDLVSSTAIPILQERLSSWNPFLNLNSSEPLQLFSDWKILLRENEKTFHTIVWEAWMPLIRRCVENWDIRNSDPIIQLLQNWESVIPSSIYTHILEQILLPKISSEIHIWKPFFQDQWILPWFPVMGTKLEEFYPIIRQNMVPAFINWQPGDVFTKKMLTPWFLSPVFNKKSVTTFLARHVIPKLQLVLEDFIEKNLEILPQNFDVKPWNLVMESCELFPCKSLIVDILWNTFFSKWLEVLAIWLNQTPQGPLEDIKNWYTRWRTLFPDELMQESLVQEGFRRALEMIDMSIITQDAQIDFDDIINRPRPRPVSTVQQLPPAQADPYIPDGFKDLVQMKCEKLGLLFMPIIPSRYHEGKQIYRCGKVSIFITANVIFTLRDGSWIPISLRKLIQTASK